MRSLRQYVGRKYVNGKQHLRSLQQARNNKRAVQKYTQPNNIFFQEQLIQFFDCEQEWLAKTATEYRECARAWSRLSGLQSQSKQTDGFAKSLDVAEGFVLWTLVKLVRPKIVVELGVQYGISSRLWKEALCAYVPEHKLVLCDLNDKRLFIDDSEAEFFQEDARQILPELFATGNVGILHNDAHPYDLIHWSISEALRHNVNTLTFHDIGKGNRGPFKPQSFYLTKQEKMDNSEKLG